MLAIRMQRTGRSGHAQFRVIVQDARSHPKSGKVVGYLGSYNPHTKTAQLKSEEIAAYMEKGAQPSDRVAKLLKAEGIKLPTWVKISPDKKRSIKHLEKLRRNAPPGEKPPAVAEPESAEPEVADEAPVEKTEVAEQVVEQEPVAEQAPEPEAEKPAEASEQEPEQPAPEQSEEAPAETVEVAEEPEKAA